MKKRRIHIVVGAWLVALLLWVIVTMGEEYQATIHVPVRVENIPQNKAIRTPVPRSLQIKCAGDGWRLARFMFRGEPECLLDVVPKTGDQDIFTLREIVERLSLPGGVRIIDMRPESLFVALETTARKHVPVVLDARLSFKDGYGQIGVPVLMPESVRVEGAESVVKRIPAWPTDRVLFDNLKATVETELALADTSSYVLEFSPSRVHVRITVQPFAEKTFSGMAVEVFAVPSNREVILIPPKIDIIVRGGIEQLSALTVRDFRASLNYEALLNDTTGFTGPEISPPPGVTIVSRRPERLQYVIRRRL